MTRMAFMTLCFVAALALPAQAQQAIGMRVGDHGEYSRVVFDWPQNPGYQVSKISSTQIEIAFNKSAALNGDVVAGKNIRDFKIVSNDPLRVALTIPEGSRTRDFTIGSKVVIDIYNPPGAPAQEVKAPEPPPPVTPPAPVAAPESAPPAEPKPGPPPVDLPSMAPPSETATLPASPEAPPESLGPAGPPAPVAAAPSPEPEPVPVSDFDTHVITITSTQNVGVAAFDNFGELWMVTDINQYYLEPQINGPHPELFGGIKEAPLEGGKAYATTVPPGGNIRGQGGGLLWRMIVSAEAEDREPIEPVRKVANASDVRGGMLIWKFTEASAVLNFKDPLTGEMLKVVTTKTSKDTTGPARDFIDFETLPSIIGLVIRPRVDDLEVKLTTEGVEVSRPGGLALVSEDKVDMARRRLIETPEDESAAPHSTGMMPRIFSFQEWQMGGLGVMAENENIILGKLHDKPQGQKYDDLMKLAKMHLANGRAAEAMGFLSYAEEDLEGLSTNPDFLALRGVAQALDYKSEEAFDDLSVAALKQFPEINYWRAYVLADLGDWQQAGEIMPTDLNALYDYPPEIRDQLALTLSEVALRAANVDLGEELLSIVERDKDNLPREYIAGLQYLQGEAHRQSGDEEEARKLWEALAAGPDELYRAKAGLALTRLKFEKGEIDAAAAIDALERLRYTWRGDELEASVNYWLGRTYFDTNDYVKGLTMMRDATTYAPGTNLGKRITEEMAQAFSDLFLEHLDKVSPIDAVTIYEQFTELSPPGAAGDKIVELLAEHLVKADLLARAADMLQHQIDHRLQGDEAARVSVRLAAIRLLDRQPEPAVKALDHAATLLRALPPEVATEARFAEITLLRARALSQEKKPQQALALLEGLPITPDVNRLKADIAWQAGYWEDAAEALQDVVMDEDISLTRPLIDEHATLILNLAISLNLAGDRIELANVRERYADAMAQTEKARLFEVVTRPRQNAMLADRDTLQSIVSEVDLFSEFLNSYKGASKPAETKPAEPAEGAAATPAPAAGEATPAEPAQAETPSN